MDMGEGVQAAAHLVRPEAALVEAQQDTVPAEVAEDYKVEHQLLVPQGAPSAALAHSALAALVEATQVPHTVTVVAEVEPATMAAQEACQDRAAVMAAVEAVLHMLTIRYSHPSPLHPETIPVMVW
jgi:hypothetical protein